MPVTVVVGGQFGSEGKGKVAYWWARQSDIRIAVRVGGPNSGHTVVLRSGQREVLRHLPTPALLPDTISVLPPGSYIEPSTFLDEVQRLKLGPDRVRVDPSASIVTVDARRREAAGSLGRDIGSTQTGTGAAVAMRVARDGSATFAMAIPELQPYLTDTAAFLRDEIGRGARVLIEGTQGFGLSLLHSRDYPFTTSRDTSAAGMLSEAGLGPLDVDEVVMVLRAYPIRVSGHSGPLPNEIDWATVKAEGSHDHDIVEYTSVTHRLRRVARFDAAVVRRAIEVNAPSTIVMNHLDYVDHAACSGRLTPKVMAFLEGVEDSIGRQIDFGGIGPVGLLSTGRSGQGVRAATG
jgi:adenylosuccinate synthase